MTPAQLEVAQRHADAWTRQQLGYAKPNMAFVSGAIEALDAAGLQAGSVDLVISNCVINLSPDKAAVLAQAHHVLADGGELYFSGGGFVTTRPCHSFKHARELLL